MKTKILVWHPNFESFYRFDIETRRIGKLTWRVKHLADSRLYLPGFNRCLSNLKAHHRRLATPSCQAAAIIYLYCRLPGHDGNPAALLAR